MLPAKPEKTALTKSAFARARERLTARQEEKRAPETRIGFIVDATGSRERTWEEAQTIQATIFRSVASIAALSLRLVHFGGSDLTDHGWSQSPREVAARMARVRCARGVTQIISALWAFALEPPESRAQAVILIGDAFEEDIEDAARLGIMLKDAGIKVFSFLEGKDWTAETAFRRLAEATGGKFAKLGADLPLADLCEGAALLAAGGEKALARLTNKKVRQLLLTGPAGK